MIDFIKRVQSYEKKYNNKNNPFSNMNVNISLRKNMLQLKNTFHRAPPVFFFNAAV